MAVTPGQAVDAANEVFGRHPGARALHAKGTLLAGTFAALPGAAALTRAAHLQPETVVAVTARFSNGSGDPGHPDWAPDPRGLAVKLYLPDGSKTDIVAVSSPLFPTRTPEGFIELMRAQGAGAAAAWRMPLFLRHHPEAIRVLPQVAPTLLPPASYASIPYFGLHAFKWSNGSGAECHVRYTLRPEIPVSRLAPWRARRLDRDYLQREIAGRVADGPVRFTLEVQLADPGDPVDDPSAGWPKSRRRIDVAILQLTGLETEREQGDDVLVFDPSRVTEGIQCSEDPILRFRPAAYSESVRRRTGA